MGEKKRWEKKKVEEKKRWRSVNIAVMRWIALTRESVTAGVSGRIDKGTEKDLR